MTVFLLIEYYTFRKKCRFFSVICFQLFCQISSYDLGKISDIPDIGKILSKDLLFRCKILLFSRKYSQNTDPLAAEAAHFCCSVCDGIFSLIRCRIFCIGTIDNNIVRTSITENDQNLFLFLPVQQTVSCCPDGKSVLDEDLPKLADSYICDSFFVPDMPVRVQRYSVTGIDKEYGAATAAFVINADSAKTRVLCEKQTGGARLKKGSQASCWVQNGDTITVYIFGELPKEELIWTLYENGACEKVIEGTVSSEFSEMTFKDYALRGYDENSGILESDWYNAQVELLRLGSEIWGNGLVQIEAGVFSLMRWYEYTITLEPGQTLKNAVTAPLYPAIDADYTPSIYAYTYLLSPAKTWTQFGELDITVNTPYYMTECGIDGFTRTDSGYALTLPGLPEGELTFTLSEAERPQPPKRSILHLMPTELIIVPAAVLVAVAAVFLPARRKRRTKR